MVQKILLVDDEEDILELIRFNLEGEGYNVFAAQEGHTAIKLAVKEVPDLIILDVMLPGHDGWEVIRELQKNLQTQHIPVIFLTAKDNEIDEIVGLELGAADYVVKPVSMRKLVARVKNVFRMQQLKDKDIDSNLINAGALEIYPENFLAKVAGVSVDLTKKEFEILLYLAERPGRVISRNTLLNGIWGDDIVIIDRTIDVHIRKIREKLGAEADALIETIRGVGYRFKE
ncbi:MAG: DNA-binding response regulator [Calditrichaeota bacterium]|nr:MAG: DNA-binding response regulator [Calditrichota bacterium]